MGLEFDPVIKIQRTFAGPTISATKTDYHEGRSTLYIAETNDGDTLGVVVPQIKDKQKLADALVSWATDEGKLLHGANMQNLGRIQVLPRETWLNNILNFLFYVPGNLIRIEKPTS